jgi:CheY-like chemotaxis protein
MNPILLVNDNIEAVTRTTSMLNAMDWDVDVAGTEEYVFESCVAHRPALVIVDLEMEGGAGFDCLGTARRLFPDLFIIAVTRGAEEKLLSAASAICGADRFIAGPLSSLGLSEAIDSGIAEGIIDL